MRLAKSLALGIVSFLIFGHSSASAVVLTIDMEKQEILEHANVWCSATNNSLPTYAIARLNRECMDSVSNQLKDHVAERLDLHQLVLSSCNRADDVAKNKCISTGLRLIGQISRDTR